jgi:ribosomal protein S18 acetylase RimI-like enzyme
VDLWRREGGPTRLAGGAEDARRLLTRDPDALLIAEDDTGRLLGTLIVGWDGWRCHLYRLVAEPEQRRSGVARALVEAARDRALALGATRIDAMVDPDNDAAVGFWAAVGFELDVDRRWSLLLS